MKTRINMTAADGLLVAFVLVLAAVLFVLMPHWVLSGGTDVEVRSGDHIRGRYSLNEDRLVEVQGPLGTTVLRIHGGRAKVESSPCPDKLCIRMGEVGREGGVIACVPNQVVISVGQGRSGDLDAVSR
jgi:hypothetical protein